MGLSNEELKLFYKPTAKRYEPSVELSAVIPDSILISDSDIKSSSRIINKIDLLNKGFSAIANDYAKMINVLKIRAGYLDLKMPVLSTSKDNPSLANASLTVYGTVLDTLSYEQYIDLSLYGKEMSSNIISNIASVTDYESIPAVLGQAVNSNPITAAIQILLKAYSNFLVSKGFAEFLVVNQYISGLTGANSHLSVLREAKKTVETVSASEPNDNPMNQQGFMEQATNQLKSKRFEEWLKDCFPCNFRAYENGDMLDNVIVDWLNAMSASFFNSLSQLLNAKFPLLNLNIKQDLCSLIAALVNFVCVPDLVSIVSMFTMMVAKLQAKLNLAFSIDFSFSVTFITDLISNLLNLIYSKLMEIVNIAIAPIECVLLALNTQMSKLYLGEETKSVTDYIQPRQYTDIFTSKIRTAKDNIDATVRQFSENIAKSLRWSQKKDAESTYLLFDLNETKFLLSLVTEIVNISIAIHKVSKNGKLEKMNISEIIDYLCNNYTGGQLPWMEKVQTALNEAQSAVSAEIEKLRPENKKEDNPAPNPSTGGPDPVTGGIAPSGFDLNKASSEDTSPKLIAIDKSITPEFFDNDALDLMDDPAYRQLQSETDYSPYESLEQGEANFKFNDQVLSQYKANKQLLFDTYNQVNNKLSSQNGIELQFMPTTYIDFSNCYQNVGIDNYSDSFINELINRVKQS